MKTAEIGLLG